MPKNKKNYIKTIQNELESPQDIIKIPYIFLLKYFIELEIFKKGFYE